MSEKEKLDYFEEGYKAFYQGLNIHDSPECDRDEREMWMDGWDTAMREATEQRNGFQGT